LALNAQVPGILHSHLAVRINAEVEGFIGAVYTRYQWRRERCQSWQWNGAAIYADAEGVSRIGCSTTADSADLHFLAVHGVAEADAKSRSHNQPDTIQAVVEAAVTGADHRLPVTKNSGQERGWIPGEGQAWLEITPFGVVGILPSQRFDRRKAKRRT